MHDILQKIVSERKGDIAQQKQQIPLDSFIQKIRPNRRDFYAALRGDGINYILECKKASPSKGLIRAEFDLPYILDCYKAYASCISVLTEERYFQGSFDYLQQAAEYTDIPLLCKDFFVDSYQIYYARYKGASAILLMLSVLDDATYAEFSDLAHRLNMAVLTEVHSEGELKRALALKAKLIGINNRNLKDLSIDLSTTKKLAQNIPDDVIVISESGIQTFGDIQDLRSYCNGFLIGSTLMGNPDLPLACKKLFFGENKICGLTRPEDAYAAYDAGSIYGGLIFVKSSKRYVTIEQAKLIMIAAPLQYVGVFMDAPIDHIASIARDLELSAVQLHGKENADYIAHLRTELPLTCQIWKSISVETTLPSNIPHNVDIILFDTKHQGQTGGTGKSFDWTLLNDYDHGTDFMVAGGLGADNVHQAMALGAKGLDFNSAVEQAVAIKDSQKIHHVFHILKGAK